ncbi:MAG: glycoside hydrolase family 28 protein [Opitutaceae bacterium]|nr:glycoside hydrolase family 28 protein [Opitutaceae bacterium]
MPPSFPATAVRFMLLPTLVILVALALSTARAEPAADPWALRDEILRRIVPPTFPDRDFVVTAYGAVADARTDCREAFAKAIAACTQAGGGRVVVPAGGVYFCDGPIHLASNVNFHVAAGATVQFGLLPERYLPVVLTRFEGTLLMGHSPRIYVRGAKNVALTGQGTIDGNGRDTLTIMRNSPARGGSGTLRQMGADGVPVEQRVFGEGKWMRPSMIQFLECTDVLIEDVRVIDSPFWVIHPVLCRNVTVRGVTVDSHNGNNDGCDPDSCSDVLIENCVFRTGDDAIAIKSGRDRDGWTVGRPSENIVIRNVTMGSRHSGLCIGSEMSGGVRNVFVEDCQLESVASAFYFKGNLDRGGQVERIYARRLHAKKVREGLVRFETGYHGYRGGNAPPRFRDFHLTDLSCDEAVAYGIYSEGVAAAPIENVRLERVRIHKAKAPFWLKFTEGLRLQDVEVNGVRLPEQPPLTPEGEVKLKISS